MAKIDKMKRSTGEVLAVHEIVERKPDVVKNFGITIRYNSRSGTHNMYKEYRDLTLCGAVQQMYDELAGLHRARFSSIHIVDARPVPSGVKALAEYKPETHGPVPPVAVQRTHIRNLLKQDLAFPLPHRITRPTSKSFRSTFKASRPSTYFG